MFSAPVSIMGLATDLESTHQVSTFGSPKSDELLEKFDNHLASIKQSLAVARISMDKFQGLVNRKEDKNKTQSSNLSVLTSMNNENVRNTNEKVTKTRPKMRNQENMDVNYKERCQYVSVLTTEAINATARVSLKAKRNVSSHFDVNYNASDQTLNQESESNIVHTLPEEAVLSQESVETTVEIATPGNAVEEDAETNNEQVILNLDLLPAPSIMITSATPFEQEIEDENEPEEKIALDQASVSTDKRISKQVSFNETAIEEVVIIQESSDSRRDSLDEGVLGLAEKRQLDEETRKMSLKHSQSSDLVVKSASKVLMELRKAAEAEVAARFEDDEYKVAVSPVADTEDNVSLLAVEKHSRIETESDILERERSEATMKSGHESPSVYGEALLQPKSLTQVLKSIDKVIYKDGVAMMWKKMEYNDEEVLVPVPPNSMLSEPVHSSLSASTVMKDKFPKPPREPCDVIVKRMLGAAAYRHMFKQAKPKEVKAKIPGADWSQQLKTQRFAAKPPVLYWDEWKINKLKKTYLGPGSYEVKDFIQLSNAKPRSERGICDKLGPRFDKITQSFTPGPGAYGIGGIPHKAIEDNANRSFSTKGMLDAGDRKRNLPSTSCHLPPGTYQCKSFVEELLNKVTGLKGPYQLFSGKRNEPLRTGFFAAPKRSKIGPGYYKFRSFVEEMTTSKYNLRGRFSKLAQYPEVPTERFILFSKAARSLDTETPGPGAYDVKELPKYTTVNPPGFLSSARRDDKLSERIFTMTCHPVGPGRYSTEKFEEPRVNGHTNVFKSKTGKPNLQLARFYEERLKTKQRSDQISSCYPGKTTRPIISMTS